MGFETGELMDLQIALRELQEESGKIAKQDILRHYSDLKYFKDTLYFLYNNMIVTGISKKKLADPRGQKMVVGWTPLDSYAELLEYLRHHNTGRLANVSSVYGMISNYQVEYPEVYEMLKGIVTKDIPLGVSGVTLNKVWGKDFVPKFDVMKAQKFEDRYLGADGNLKVTHAVTTKLDGSRCAAIIGDNGKVTFMARSGKPYEGLREISSELDKLGWEDVIFDGELVAENPDNLSAKELFAKTQKILRTKEEDKTGLEFHIYDIIPLDEFKEGKSKLTYEDRREELLMVDEEVLMQGLKKVKVLPVHFYTKDMEQIQNLATEIVDSGGEGLMLNAMNGYYVTKRTNQLLKVKKFHTVDLRCLDVIEETRGGTLGAIVVDYKGYRVKVGSGFSHSQRAHFWMEPEVVVGKIVEVGFFEETTNSKDDSLSLRFPTFKRIRSKSEVSYH